MATTLRDLVIRVRSDTKQASGQLADIGEIVTGIQSAFTLLANAARAAFDVTIGELNTFTAQADVIAKTAGSIGLTTDALQEYTFAAERSGATSDDLSKGIQQLGRLFRQDSITGTKTSPLQFALKQLNLSFKELENLSTEEKIAEIAEAMKLYKGTAEASAIAGGIFGEKNGVKLVNLLTEGKAGIAGLREEARKYGRVIREDVLRSSEAYQDSLTNLQSAITGLKTQALGPIIPIASQVADKIRDWILANRELIKQRIEKFIGALPGFIEKVRKEFDKWMPRVKEAVRTVSDFSRVLLKVANTATTRQVGTLAVALGAVAIAIRKVGEAASFVSRINPWIAGLTVALGVLTEIRDMYVQIEDAEFGGVGRLSGGQTKISDQLKNAIRAGKIDLLASTEKTELVKTLADLPENIADKIVNVTQEKVGRGTREDAQFSILRSELGRARAQRRQEKQDEEENRKALETMSEAAKEIAEQAAQRKRDRLAAATKIGGGESEAVRTAELLKLIDQAARGGRSLSGLLNGRRIEGGVPPVITVTQHFFNLTNHVNIAAKGGSTGEVVESVMRKFQSQTDADLRRAVKAIGTPEIG